MSSEFGELTVPLRFKTFLVTKALQRLLVPFFLV